MSEVLLKDLSLIDYVKDSGLVLFTWGEDNNNASVIDKLKKLKVDAIIYDRYKHLQTWSFVQSIHFFVLSTLISTALD